jgi:hypothetical protein
MSVYGSKRKFSQLTITLFRFSIFLFAIVGLGLFLLGCLYLSLDEFMPYHAEALQKDWGALDSNSQGLILGLLKGFGSGACITGFAILFMVASSLRKTPRPFIVLLPLTAVGYSALLCYATFTVYLRTPGNPPVLLTVALVATGVLASIALAISQRPSTTD